MKEYLHTLGDAHLIFSIVLSSEGIMAAMASNIHLNTTKEVTQSVR